MKREALASAGRRMRVDAWTAEAVEALRSAGIRSVLLKGPAVSGWLYADQPASRTYGDVDLLVGPADHARAAQVLVDLGYAMPRDTFPRRDEPHARAFKRPVDGAEVDLHRVLHGMETLAPATVWNVVSAETETIFVGLAEVEIPGVVVRTLHVGLHLSPKDGAGSQPWRDLQRAVERVDRRTWAAAGLLARSLGVEAELGHRLGRLSDASDLAAELDLPREETQLHAMMRVGGMDGSTRGVLSVFMLAGQRSPTARVAYVSGKLFPPAEVLKARSRLARREPAGLMVTRVARVLVCVARAPGAVRAWRRIRSRQPSH